uniref:Uncharacterized protein n=1 Tax=Arundo donax TaxID=35708 RepID=A0A0A9HVF4_ARUDO
MSDGDVEASPAEGAATGGRNPSPPGGRLCFVASEGKTGGPTGVRVERVLTIFLVARHPTRLHRSGRQKKSDEAEERQTNEFLTYFLSRRENNSTLNSCWLFTLWRLLDHVRCHLGIHDFLRTSGVK